MRTIDLNPVRAGIVAHSRDYRWSSYAAHAHGAPDAALVDAALRGHDLYRRLGASPAERQRDDRALFRAALDPDFVDALRRGKRGQAPFRRKGV